MLYLYIALTLLFITLLTLSCFQPRKNIEAIHDIGMFAKILGLICSIGMCIVQGLGAFNTVWFPLCFSLALTGFGSSVLTNIPFYTMYRSKVDIPIFVIGALGTVGMIILSLLCY